MSASNGNIRGAAWRLLLLALLVGVLLALGGCAVVFNVAIGNTASSDLGALAPAPAPVLSPPGGIPECRAWPEESDPIVARSVDNLRYPR